MQVDVISNEAPTSAFGPMYFLPWLWWFQTFFPVSQRQVQHACCQKQPFAEGMATYEPPGVDSKGNIDGHPLQEEKVTMKTVLVNTQLVTSDKNQPTQQCQIQALVESNNLLLPSSRSLQNSEISTAIQLD